MINGVSAEQAIINQVFEALPEVKSKKEHILKKGESLWGLAKQELGNKNLSNREIRDYMLLIAKLNGLDTVKKMNGLMANQKIYLPESTGEIHKMTVKEKSTVDKTVEDLVNTLKNDKTVYVKGVLFGATNSNLFHIFKEKSYPNGYRSTQSPVLSFNIDKNGEVVNLTTNDVEDIFPTRYDYEIQKDGKVHLRNYPPKVVDKLDEEQTAALFGEVQNLYNTYQKQPKKYY